MEELSLKELSKPELFRLFKEQLLKDYELAGCENHAPVIGSADLSAVQEAITTSLTVLSRQQTAYYSLLYRIDITEQQIYAATQAEPETDLLHTVALLIIKRELQKIILKQLYSSHDPEH